MNTKGNIVEFEGYLPNAPLIYVLGSVGFTPVLSMEQHISSIQEQLRHEYPLAEASEVQNVAFHIESNSSRTVTSTSKIWHFMSIDRKWAFSIESEKVLLHTSCYQSFNEFSLRFRAILEVLKTVLNIDYSMYQGIRYIDLVKPSNSDALSSYLPEGMLIGHINGVAGKQIDGFSGASFQTKFGNLAVRCWMNPLHAFPPDLMPLFSAVKFLPNHPNGEFAILDTDHASLVNGISFDIDTLISNLDEMHKVCHKAFEGIATEYAIRIWQQKT